MSARCPPHGPSLVQLAAFTGIFLFLVYLNLALFQNRDFEASWGITDSMDMNLSKLQETVEDRGAWHDAVHEITELDTTEQQKQQQHSNNHMQ